MSSYFVLEHFCESEEVIKNSRFITRAFCCDTVDAAKNQLKTQREKEPEATHHCWAYIVGNPSCTTLIGCSDDGEPSGTAGKPMLHVLQHSNIGDILVICTRFYGGTKLGTGGLARAYGGGVKLVLESVKTIEKINKKRFEFRSDYSSQKDLEHELNRFDAEILSTEYLSDITYSISIAEDNYKALLQQLTIRFGEKISWNHTQE